MDSIDFDAWETDVANGRARHATGFSLCVEGDVRNPSSVAPADYPPGLSYADQARLLRCGMQALASAPSDEGINGYAQKRTQIKTRARRAEASAKLFAERKDRPERPRLSLRK